MAHSVRPSDGTRPSDPKDLIFETDPETIRSQIREREIHRLPSRVLLSVVIGILVVIAHIQIATFAATMGAPLIPDWAYYVSLVLTGLASAALLFRWLRP